MLSTPSVMQLMQSTSQYVQCVQYNVHACIYSGSLSSDALHLSSVIVIFLE